MSADEIDERQAIIEYNRQREKTLTQRMRESEELDRIEAERAKQRQVAVLKQGDEQPVVATLPERDSGRTRDKVSEAIGMKPRTYEKAKAGDEESANKEEASCPRTD